MFVVLLTIPLFQLSKRRVLEECSGCGTRRVMTMQEWQQWHVGEMEERARALAVDPADADAAIELLATVQAFHDKEAFESLAACLRGQFGEDPEVLDQLGETYSLFRQFEEAEECYRQSAAVEDCIELRSLRALNCLRQGRPQEAEPFLEEILEERREDLRWCLYLGVEGYQLRGEHDKAALLLQRLTTVWPNLAYEAEHKRYQERVRRGKRGKKVPSLYLQASDYAPASLLASPGTRFTVVPAVLLYLLVTYTMGQDRTVFLVNGLSRPYDVEIERKLYHVSPGVPESVHLREGRVPYTISGDKNSAVASGEVEISTFWLTRPFASLVFVINPDQVAVLATDQLRYAKKPDPKADAKLKVKVYCSKRLYQFSDIDLPFKDFPLSITTYHHHLSPAQFIDMGHVLTRLSQPDLSLAAKADALRQLGGDEEARSFVRNYLQLDPTYQALILAKEILMPDVLLELARPHLEAQPIQTMWHRVYQDLARRQVDVVAEYRQRLARSPQDQQLQYLLARALAEGEESTRLYKRSIDGTAPSAFGCQALASEALSRGDFAAAEGLCRQGLTGIPQLPELFQDTRQAALWGLRRWTELLAEGSENKGNRIHFLMAAGQPGEAQKLADDGPTDSDLHLQLLYAQGKLPEFVAEARRLGGSWAPVADLVEGKLAEVSVGANSSISHLLLYLVATVEKNEAVGRRELEAAIAGLRDSSQDANPGRLRAADYLERPAAPEAALSLNLPLDEKRLFLAAMTVRDPAHRQIYRRLADKLNFDTRFPYWTIRQVLEKAR